MTRPENGNPGEMSLTPRWPASLTLVRHGESAGNVALARAEAAGDHVIEIATRDMDVPLSDRGREQAVALGHWIDASGSRPSVVLASPYVRAAETARIAADAAGMSIPIDLDERLREREFGVLDGLTKAGIVDRFPGEADARAHLGKFYYRPPGGESWCDVALRVRSVVDTIGRAYAGEDVLVVAHQVVVMLFCYVLDRMDEASILALSAEHELANCSITRYELAQPEDHVMRQVQFNSLVALAQDTAPVTVEPDVPAGPR